MTGIDEKIEQARVASAQTKATLEDVEDGFFENLTSLSVCTSAYMANIRAQKLLLDLLNQKDAKQ